jgi:dihydrofolate reductase
MPQVRFTLSLSADGFVAGPNQSLDTPLGERGRELHEWAFATRTFSQMQGREGGDTGLDDERAANWNRNVGATIMGRNMFGPVRGDWGDGTWDGWWGDDPPYHNPVFVLTHHPREPIEMQGGTTFHFVTDGIESALAQARDAAGDRDVAVAGGCSTVQQFLRAGLIDEFELHVAPVLLGRGERLFDSVDVGDAGYRCERVVSSPAVAHYLFSRSA